MTALAPPEAPSRWRQLAIWLAFIGLDTGTQIAFKWGAEGLGDMIDAAARSPLVQTIGQRDQITVGLGATYSFRFNP